MVCVNGKVHINRQKKPCLYIFSSDLFCHKNKTVFGPGDVLRFPKLAETMEIIAKEGADTFYTGKIGRDLIDDVKAEGA